MWCSKTKGTNQPKYLGAPKVSQGKVMIYFLIKIQQYQGKI